jgi:L-methionine (R)-S-oxide reductase
MDKQEKYNTLLKNIEDLIRGEEDIISVMATIACELKHTFETFSWAGFYRVVKPETLKVGPYQGPHGCLEISFKRGVCGKCATERITQIVDDVSTIPYHISCSSESKSEIVVPVFNKQGTLIAVMDIDSNNINNFDKTDIYYLESICSIFRKI